MRRGRYRKNWLSPGECFLCGERFAPSLHLLMEELLRFQFSDAEFVARYLELGFTTAKLFEKGRPTSLPVNHTLLSWHQGHFPLHLCEHIPSTEEVLSALYFMISFTPIIFFKTR